MMYNYIKKVSPETQITYSTNYGKKHGIKPKLLEEYFNTEETILLIVPDAGTNDLKEVEELIGKYDLDVLCIDHHEPNEETLTSLNDEGVILINNQISYENPDMSGAGVVYKFIKEYDKMYGYDYADDFLDLFALGNVGDSMDMRSLETRRLTTLGCLDI